MENEKVESQINEKLIKPKKGMIMLILLALLTLASFACICIGGAMDNGFFVCGGLVVFLACLMLYSGFKIVAPNEAVVLLLFGKYYGTIKQDGFYYVNPFCVSFNPAIVRGAANATRSGDKSSATVALSRKISLKAMTLDNQKQKVNDLDGNPIEIGVVVIWKIVNTAKAVFAVDNYKDFVSIQSDATIRNIARQFPYDTCEDDSSEKSLRGSSQEISSLLVAELQKRVEVAGIEIIEARISHLAYAQEIAAAMLQRQQAKAIIDARTKIVEGAVGMVDLALKKLSAENIVELDAERKAQMVSNLLVVLCGSKETQPVVNSGTIY